MYPVVIECYKNKKRRYKYKFRLYGLKWNGIDAFVVRLNKKNYAALSYYCAGKHLKIYINNEYGTRSFDYRKRFFDANPPVIRNMYFCAYCGRLRRKRDITIDHLYPVGCAKKSIKLQKKLSNMGIENINDIKNLVPACERCNKSKSNRMGAWIVKGKIGRHPMIWVARHFLRIIIFISICLIISNARLRTNVIETIDFTMNYGLVKILDIANKYI